MARRHRLGRVRAGRSRANGVLDVLLAREGFSPTGRLPVTWYANGYLDEVGPILDYGLASGAGRTYRFLDESRAPPLFRFGFGLSFSRFAYAKLSVARGRPRRRRLGHRPQRRRRARGRRRATVPFGAPRRRARGKRGRNASRGAQLRRSREPRGLPMNTRGRCGHAPSVALRFRLEEQAAADDGRRTGRASTIGDVHGAVGGASPRGRTAAASAPPRLQEARESNVVRRHVHRQRSSTHARGGDAWSSERQSGRCEFS